MSGQFKKYLFSCLGLVLVILLVVVFVRVYDIYQRPSQLQRVIAETNRRDPGWRMEELDAAKLIVQPGIADNEAEKVKNETACFERDLEDATGGH